MVTKVRTELTLTDKTAGAFASFKRNVSGVRGLVAGIGAAFSAVKFGQFAIDSLKAADEIGKLSDRLGVSTEALSEYQHVANLTGVSFRELTNGFQRMGRRVSEAARGQGAAVDTLRELGLEAKTLTNLELDTQFEILADAISGVTNETDRVRIAQKLFDSEGVKLLQTMKGGAAAIRGYREEAREAGLTLSRDTADGASKALDAWTRLSAGTTALGVTLVSELAGPINSVIDWLGNFIPDAVEETRKAFFALQAFIADVGTSITGAFAAVENALGDVAEFIGADVAAKAFRRAGAEYEQAGDVFTAVADRQRTKLIDLNETRARGLQAGITYQQVYNAELAKQGELTTTQQQALDKTGKEAERQNQRRLASIKDYIEQLQTEVDTLGLSNTELVRYRLNKLKATEPTISIAVALRDQLDAEEAIAAIEKENAEIMARSAELQQQETEAITKRWEDTGQAMGSALSEAISEGGSFKDTIKSIEDDLIRIASKKLMEQAFGGVGQTGAGGGGGFFGGILSGLLKGFAGGGRMSPGQTGIVGEHGPEMITAGPGGASVSPTINVNVNGPAAAPGGGSSMQLAAQIGEQVSRALRRNR